MKVSDIVQIGIAVIGGIGGLLIIIGFIIRRVQNGKRSRE